MAFHLSTRLKIAWRLRSADSAFVPNWLALMEYKDPCVSSAVLSTPR